MKIITTFKKFKNTLLNHIKTLTILFSILIVTGVGLFLYYNFYQTIISAKQIIILQSDIAPSTVDIRLLEQVENKFKIKTQPKNINWDNFKNIFSGNLTVTNNQDSIDSDISPKISF